MKCLTVCEPYAFGITLGVKPVENRTWFMKHRGLLAIHAGKSRSWLGTLSAAEAVEMHQAATAHGYASVAAGLRFGELAGIVNVVDCIRWTEAQRRYPHKLHWIGEEWCICLELVCRFPRGVPYRGAQGLYNVPDRIIDAARHGEVVTS